MPYRAEHSCRLRSPDDFQERRFRRMKSGKAVLIIGRLKGETKSTAQAMRFPTKDWSVAEARASCRRHHGSFHPAKR